MCFRLDPFADRFQPQRGGHAHQLRQDDLTGPAFIELFHKAHIEFQKIEAYALKYVKRGIAAAEVVHPHGKAKPLKLCDLFLDKVKIAADDALRDFYCDFVPADARFVHAPADLLHDIAGVKIRTGQVDGMRDDIKPLRFQRFDIVQNLFQHIQIQLVNEARFLQRGNKACRRQEAAGRIDPARERLLVANLSVYRADDRLVVNLNPFPGDRPVDVLDNVLSPLRVIAQLLFVILIAGRIGPVQLIAGELCPVAGETDVLCLILVGIDADVNRDGSAVVDILVIPQKLAQSVLQPLRHGDYRKMVSAYTAAAVIAEGANEQLCKRLQQLVALREAIFLVIKFHSVEIQIQIGGFAAAFQDFLLFGFRQLEESGHARQARQKIIIVSLFNALPQLLFQIVPVLLLLVFQHEAVEQAGAEQAADRVHRQQRIAGLQHVKDSHRHAEHADDPIAGLLHAGTLLGNGSGVDRGHHKHHDLSGQRNIAPDSRVIDALFVKVEHDRPDKSSENKDQLKRENQLARNKQNFPKAPVFAEIIDGKFCPHQDCERHGDKIKLRVQKGQAKPMPLIEQAPDRVRHIVGRD